VTRRHWAEREYPKVVTKGRRTEWLVVMYSYINVSKSLYFLNYFDFLELSCISSNFLKSLDFYWFCWFFSIFLNFLIFLDFSRISLFS
jgi:hypothetical protein